MKDRLKLLLQHLDLSAAEFADSIGVQRSSISHILSGRNNPGMDYLQKILRAYPQVNPEWLVIGSGNIARDETQANLENTGKPASEEKKTPGKDAMAAPSLEKIVWFYSDGTFREYHPGK